MKLKTVNMGDLEGIVSAEMLLTLLRWAEDIGEEAVLNLQYDGLPPDEYETEVQQHQAYLSAVGEVCERITKLLMKGGVS